MQCGCSTQRHVRSDFISALGGSCPSTVVPRRSYRIGCLSGRILLIHPPLVAEAAEFAQRVGFGESSGSAIITASTSTSRGSRFISNTRADSHSAKAPFPPACHFSRQRSAAMRGPDAYLVVSQHAKRFQRQTPDGLSRLWGRGRTAADLHSHSKSSGGDGGDESVQFCGRIQRARFMDAEYQPAAPVTFARLAPVSRDPA